ncbi:hypothetical protein T12_7106 [Trichinella patagoniensis]|uniref:Uncharacterized protein n=1 Tax=Trichinella patagoniensis TaxID=990121 RepID=A0A0V1A2H5_9BILA|nr:hypothetical protein T12_7106 [Trichinella patagoniensis]
MTYLRCFLTGDALGSIICLCLSNANYEVEVRRLKERFERLYTVVRKETLVLRRSPASNGRGRNSLIPSNATSVL